MQIRSKWILLCNSGKELPQNADLASIQSLDRQVDRMVLK